MKPNNRVYDLRQAATRLAVLIAATRLAVIIAAALAFAPKESLAVAMGTVTEVMPKFAVSGQPFDPPRAGDTARVTVTPVGDTNSSSPVLLVPGRQAVCAVSGVDDQNYYGASDHKAGAPRPKIWSCRGGQFVVGMNSDGTLQMASVTTGDTPTWIAPQAPGNYAVICAPDDSSRSVAASVIVVSASLSVRRTGATQPDGENETRPADFSSSATVAVGGLSSDEHKGDVKIHVSMPDGSPAPAGLSLGASAHILSGGQGPVDGTILATLETV